jgi:glycosyltransferase involved in cell wall biosynthesis
VIDLTLSLIAFELRSRWSGLDKWPGILQRNSWFQGKVVEVLKRFAPWWESEAQSLTLFAYSYSALDLLRFAKQHGWRTVLSQIDGGRRDEEIVAAEHLRHPDIVSQWQPAPCQYWRAWEEECALADSIVVNSEWARRLLVEAGIAPQKLQVIPVAYEPMPTAFGWQRSYPAAFNATRPLRVLFLGAFAVRKGAMAVMEAMHSLREEPVEFWMVGAVNVQVPGMLRDSPRVKWIGPVSRQSTALYYQEADLFLFPTLSDGFGMTQVEARAWKLPIISTPFCAPIVQHGVNGLVLPELTGSQLAEAIHGLLKDPQRLKCLSDGASSEFQRYNPDRVRDQILALGA